MKCCQVILELADFANGRLGWRMSRGIRAHVSCCEECAKELRSLQVLEKRTREALRERGDAPDLGRAIMNSLPALSARPVRRRAWGYVLALGAIAVGAFALAVLLQRPGPVHVATKLQQQKATIKNTGAVHTDTACKQANAGPHSGAGQRVCAIASKRHVVYSGILRPGRGRKHTAVSRRWSMPRASLACKPLSPHCDDAALGPSQQTGWIAMIDGGRLGAAPLRKKNVVPAPPMQNAESIERPPLQVVPARRNS